MLRSPLTVSAPKLKVQCAWVFTCCRTIYYVDVYMSVCGFSCLHLCKHHSPESSIITLVHDIPLHTHQQHTSQGNVHVCSFVYLHLSKHHSPESSIITFILDVPFLCLVLCLLLLLSQCEVRQKVLRWAQATRLDHLCLTQLLGLTRERERGLVSLWWKETVLQCWENCKLSCIYLHCVITQFRETT